MLRTDEEIHKVIQMAMKSAHDEYEPGVDYIEFLIAKITGNLRELLEPEEEGYW
jgi:hypothetical protein